MSYTKDIPMLGTLPNAIHSRQAWVGPGVGVGVDIKTPTPESESTPMKTLSTPQPWLQ